MVTPPSTPAEDGRRDGGPCPESGDPGPTGFLVDDLTDAGRSAEELRETVRALIRERDYLREVRDVQMADYISQVEALTRERDSLLEERETWRDRADRAEARIARTLSGRCKRGLLWLLGRGR